MAHRGSHIYVLALGSNQPRSRTLTPRRLVEMAMETLSHKPFRTFARSRIIDTAPLGPSRRRYANAVPLIEAPMSPRSLLKHLKKIERKAGRRRAQRWAARPLDIDIILWNRGAWSDSTLTIPHPAFRDREFVLAPLAHIAPQWRDPLTGRTSRQLLSMLKKPRRKCEAG